MADTNPPAAGAAARTAPKTRLVPSPLPPEEIYVDGVAGAMGRGGVLKLDLYRVSGVDRKTGTETHRVSHRLVIPAAAIPELMRVLQGTAQAARKATEARAAAART
jgi:hypothetical protein